VSAVVIESFKNFMRDVDPEYRLPSRYHLTHKLIPQEREKWVAATNEQLDKANCPDY